MIITFGGRAVGKRGASQGGGESLPSWHPEWQSPGVIATIPGGTLQEAITDNSWSAPTDIVAGGTLWPTCLMETWCGGTVAYVDGDPYLCIAGGGHSTNPDNVIYAFGPLTADSPAWSRLSPQSIDDDISSCVDRYSDGRPSSRHTAGDFTYDPGTGRILMLWSNSPYCNTGGATPAVDAYDIAAGEWDAAKETPVSRTAHTLNPATHAASCYHAHDGLVYAKGQASHGNSFGAYDVAQDDFTVITYSGEGTTNDSSMCSMGARDYLFSFKDSATTPVRINTQTGVGESWATDNAPTNTSRCVAYDSLQDRIYTPRTGVSDPGGGSSGAKAVAWFDASASTSPTWQDETFTGDTPDQQEDNGTFGRWSFVPELKGFVLVNSITSDVYFYRTSE